MRQILSLFIAVLINVPIYAQIKYWTLDECIQYAHEHNIGIKSKTLEVDKKKINVSEQRWNFAPTLLTSSSVSVSNGRVLDPTTYDYVEHETVSNHNTSINANINLFSGMRNYHTLKRAKLDQYSALLSVEQMKNDLRLNVTACFFEILYAEDNIRIAEQIAHELQTQVDKTSKKVEARKVTIADLLQIQTQLSDAENNVLTAKQNYDIARLNLCHILEIDDYTSFYVSEPQFQTCEMTDIFVSNMSLPSTIMSRPEIQIAETQIAIAHRDLKIARASYYPTISLAVGYGSGFSDARHKMLQNNDGTYRYESYPFCEQYRDNASNYISLSLNFPIFNKFSVRKSVQQQKITIRQAEYALYQAKKQVIKEITHAIIDAKTAYAKYNTALMAVESANEATRQITLKYELGVVSVIDYNASITSQYQALSRFYRTKYEYIFKCKILEYYAQ